ncbi:Helicase PriA essential for oriC/DnaA-independent DNA replication [Olavius algarvensis Delta 1 endosymbiont]|nr:Helicase PriA essential for oriC/DnaA-independent DNA replication [Olavius algarvensis Delta 1 endosymbiont]
MKSDTAYIDVAVALPVFHTFTYIAADPFKDALQPGARVLVPFGRRRITGYVFGFVRNPEHQDLKPVLDILDKQPLFPAAMVPFFNWIADYYKYPIGEVVKYALPGGLNIYDYSMISITEKGRSVLENEQLSPGAVAVLKHLLAGSCRSSSLYKNVEKKISGGLLLKLEKSGWIARNRKLSRASTKARLERFIRLSDNSSAVDQLSEPRQKIMAMLKDDQEIALKLIKAEVPTAAALIKPLESLGHIRIIHKRVFRDPFGESIKPDTAPQLNREQRQAVAQACQSLNHGYHPFLLKGVTGSGKTEVYMQVAAEVLKRGCPVLVLVPEIALITQIERRFRARFGECVSVLHSGLSAGQRYDQWTRIMQGEAMIAIGARSAIFAPFDNFGVIIVDEEHDSSYKQEGKLRYNARDLAVVRAKQNGCLVILGSATPSIQSYYNATTNKFAELTLTKRVEDRNLPEIQIVDLRQARGTRGSHSFITPELNSAMEETLERQEQVLLFLNRRGFANFPVCGACGEAMRCKNCDISLTLHQRANAYRCHYCGYRRAAPSNCDVCGSPQIKHLGLGTERLEKMLTEQFSQARVARMDRDTTSRKGSIIKLLKGVKDQTIDILVGTQMVAKGHDFPNITLVGIVCADLSLNFPDFRAGERTYQLLAQVAGRAGRGDRPGRVILQTYNPQHFCISTARSQDFNAFYQQEISIRQALAYPPFTRMIQLKISGKDPDETKNHANLVGDHCRRLKTTHAAHYRSLDVMGPIEASLTRIAGRYRWQILLKGSNTGALHQFINQLRAEKHSCFTHRRIQVAIDVDPVFLM